jgi:hypothetical protein
MQDSDATALRDVAAVGVPVVIDRKRWGADMAADLTAELSIIIISRI